MNQKTSNTVAIAALVVSVALGALGWHNAAQVQANSVVTQAAPTVGETAAVALPSLGAIAAGLTSLIAFVSRFWKPSTPGETSLLQNLVALATLMTWLGSKPLSSLIAAVKANGFPAYGKIELGWTGKTPFVSEWKTPEPVEVKP